MANQQMLQQQADLYMQLQNKYAKDVGDYNTAADIYNKQVKEYQALVDAYNNAPATKQYKADVESYNQAVNAYNAKADSWSKTPITFTWYSGNQSQATPQYVYNKLVESANKGNHSEAYVNWLNNNFNYLQNTYYPGSLTATKPTDPGGAPGQFTAKKPELTATAPKDPGFTANQMSQLLGQQSLAQQERSAANEQGLVQRVQGNKQQADSIIGGILQSARYST